MPPCKLCARLRGRAQHQLQTARQRRIWLAEQLIRLLRAKSRDVLGLQPRRNRIGCFNRFFHCDRQHRGQTKAQMDRRSQPPVQFQILRANSGLHGADHIPDDIFRRIMQQGRQAPTRADPGVHPREDILDQERMLRHRIRPIALSLAVPTGDEGKAMGDVFHLNIHRSRIQKIQTPP